MKRIIFTILCALLVLCTLAETPRLNRDQIRRSVTSKSKTVATASSTAGKDKPKTLQQVLKERNLTLNDNRLNSTPHNQEPNDLEGVRIASMEVYDYDWDDETGIATIDMSSCALAGQNCDIHTSLSTGKLVVDDLFDLDVKDGSTFTFSIPLEYDDDSGVVKIKAGEALDTLYYRFENGLNPYEPEPYLSAPGPNSTDVKWILYAMPLSWLVGEDEYHDIYGQVYDDGSIAFSGEFAFLVRIDIYTFQGELTETTWGLSLIYKNLTLFKPNSIHGFRHVFDQGATICPGTGGGGFSPRPIDPRPSSTKPVKPRAFSSFVEQPELGPDGYAGADNTSELFDEGSSRFTEPKGNVDDLEMQFASVYVYWLDDTTLMAYNLYGMDYCWNYIYVYPDRSVSFPAQPITDQYNVLYNFSKPLQSDTLEWGNKGYLGELGPRQYIAWDNTYLRSENGAVIPELSGYYSQNMLSLGSGVSWVSTLHPEFDEPVVTDSTVVFSATCDKPNSVVHLYVFSQVFYDYVEVDNPWYCPRGNEAYWVGLMAVAYDEESGLWGDEVFTYYEVPALEHVFLRGDINGDGLVTLSDVTALIHYVLVGNENDILVGADMNQDGSLGINDVTTLIHYVLTRQCSDSTPTE